MKDLFVVYGSESRLLSDIYERKNTIFLKIFNNQIPLKIKNTHFVNNISDFKAKFEELLLNFEFKRIIFLGAAFKNQNQLFFGEKIEDIRHMIDTNISKYVELIHYILPFMLKKKSGQFIYLSSFRSQQTSKGTTIYSASKAFGEKFFEIIGKEYASKGVFSTSIRMGYFDGKMLEKMDTEISKKLLQNIGLRRLGNGKDLVDTVEYIINNNYTNGSVIDLTGGINFN